MAIIALSILYKFRISHTANRYVFLFTTLVKMIIYSLFIKPRIIVLFSDNKQAFYIFFIPYFTALIWRFFVDKAAQQTVNKNINKKGKKT